MGFQHGASLQQAGEPNLPKIRQDLFILPSAPSWTGAPSWIIHDGIANRYFRIDATRMAILSGWKPIPADALAKQLSLQKDTLIAVSQIKALARFLLTNSLIENAGPDEWQFYQKQKEGTRQSLWKKMVHNYLFFRVPLLKPQRFLDFIWPLVAGFFTTTSAIAFVLLAILGLYLVSHQWDVFQATFVSFLTLNGLLLYGSSLVCIKIFHEMGHALMARKYGVHVPVIGVAFIVLMPVLYTDTTSAHRLISRFKRLNIDLAGIYAELALATPATICWVFLPDGPLRSIAFTTATLSWAISLAVNLNPFMRFDGYYILSDLFGFENLQERSFLIAKWRLRETLFDLGEPVPEVRRARRPRA